MTKRERVMAALRGAPVDRVPVSLWLHNFATENSAETLTAETLRLARRFDWDFLKPQSRAQCFAEMWGLRYAPSRERATPYTVTQAPLATAADLRRLEPADARTGALGEQLQALHAIRKAVGIETPIIWTVFDEFVDYPATALSWATVPGNPSLSEAHRRTGRAVVGGLPAKPVIKGLPPAELEARGRRAIAEMAGRFLLLGPDCSIDPDTPEPVMHAATIATR